MQIFNKVVLSGIISDDPIFRRTPEGTLSCRFSLAAGHRKQRRIADGTESTWFSVTAWSRLAASAEALFRRGDHVYVEGRLSVRSFEDHNGRPKISLEVHALDLQFIARRTNGSGFQEPDLTVTDSFNFKRGEHYE